MMVHADTMQKQQKTRAWFISSHLFKWRRARNLRA